MVAYQAGLITTGLIMLITRHAQPALLYLVPFCFAGLLCPALHKGQIKEIFQYSEEEDETKKEAGNKEKVEDLAEKKEK